MFECGHYLPDMRDVVELSNDGVCNLGSVVTMRSLHLWTEVSEDDDCWLIGSNEDRSHEEFKMVDPRPVAIRRPNENLT